MKKFYLLFLLALLPLVASADVCALQNEEKMAYAVLNDEGTILTLYYDDQKNNRNVLTSVSTNNGFTYNNDGHGWPYGTSQTVTTVVFDPSFADFRIVNMCNMFSGFTELTTIKGIEYLNTEETTNMYCMFLACEKLSSIDLSNFNTANVTNMSQMFSYCYSLESLDLSSFNTSKLEDYSYMFFWDDALKTIIVGSGWNTSGITNIDNYESVFKNCESLVGGKGTAYNASYIDGTYAHIDGGSSNPGYFTEKEATIILCPDNNHPHVIDLGLPSGTKWACCNIGASEPSVFGNEYAWGETETKSKYTWETYIYCNGSKETCQDIGTNIAKTEYDVAHVKWGGSYQIPSVDDVKELIDNCTKRSVTYEGIYYTGPNGNTIFVPSRMYGWGDDTGHHGNYWTSDLSDELHIAMNWFVWESVYPAKWNNIGREAGFFVRPVAKDNGESPTEETDVDEITIKEIGKTTWCSEYDLDFTNVAGIKAYTATGYDDNDKTIWLTRVMKVPAGTGLLVKGDEGTYKVPHANVRATYLNYLKGNLGEAIKIEETDGDMTNYYLKDGTFLSVNGNAKIGKNKAYLQLPTSIFAGTRTIGISYDDEDGTTGIREAKQSKEDGAYYTLQGQRVQNPGKGLYIKNGRKVVIK